MGIKSTHPRQRFIFFVAQDVDQGIADAVKRVIADLEYARDWTICSPKFIDTRNEEGTTDSLIPDDTIGGYIEIFSAQAADKLPFEVDYQNLNEITTIIDSLKGISDGYNIEFEFYLDETFVGALEHGLLDESLATGLLGEWRKQLGLES